MMNADEALEHDDGSGCGEDGRLGNGGEETRFKPAAVELHGCVAAAVACGCDATIFVTQGGRVYATGNNEVKRRLRHSR